jgi:UPF0716 protein FxsA
MGGAPRKTRLEQFFQELAGGRLIEDAGMAGDDGAGGVDEHREGQAPGFVAEGSHYFDGVQLSVQGRVIEAHFIGERAHLAGVIDGDPQDLHATALIAFLKRDEHGYFVQAGRTPGGPEIDHQQLAVPLGDSAAPALGIGQPKLGTPAKHAAIRGALLDRYDFRPGPIHVVAQIQAAAQRGASDDHGGNGQQNRFHSLWGDIRPAMEWDPCAPTEFMWATGEYTMASRLLQSMGSAPTVTRLDHGISSGAGQARESPVFLLLLLLFFTVPLVEIYVLLEVGGVIGALPTIALVVLTAVIGAGLIRAQGLATLGRVKQELERGELPALGIIEAALLLVAGALLLTPGFVTDTIGFLILVPPLRRRAIQAFLARRVHVTGVAAGRGNPGKRGAIEGEFRREDD